MLLKWKHLQELKPLQKATVFFKTKCPNCAIKITETGHCRVYNYIRILVTVLIGLVLKKPRMSADTAFFCFHMKAIKKRNKTIKHKFQPPTPQSLFCAWSWLLLRKIFTEITFLLLTQKKICRVGIIHKYKKYIPWWMNLRTSQVHLLVLISAERGKEVHTDSAQIWMCQNTCIRKAAASASEG